MDYILNLGINPDTVTIGSIFGASSQYHPMQMALGTSGRPAWFTEFLVGDRLHVHIWNLSNLDISELGLRILIGNNTIKPSGTAYDPNHYFLLTNASGDHQPVPTQTGSQGVDVLDFCKGYWQGLPGGNSPWGNANGNWKLTTQDTDPMDMFLQFGGSGYQSLPTKMEVGFLVKAIDDDSSKSYLADPEMIVNEDPQPKTW